MGGLVPARWMPFFLAAFAVAIVAMLVLWVYPGILNSAMRCPTPIAVGTATYCSETISVLRFPGGPGSGPLGCLNTTVFRGVGFAMDLYAGAQPGGLATIQGWVSTLNHTCQEFGLRGNPLGPPVVNWTSPDGQSFVEWRSPFTGLENGAVVANLTIAVNENPAPR